MIAVERKTPLIARRAWNFEACRNAPTGQPSVLDLRALLETFIWGSPCHHTQRRYNNPRSAFLVDIDVEISYWRISVSTARLSAGGSTVTSSGALFVLT